MPTLTSANRRQPQVYRRTRRASAIACLTVTLGSAFGVSSTSADEIYRWVDADGVVNYTQQKPRDVEAQALTTQRGAPTRVRNASTASIGQAGDAGAAADAPMNDSQQRMMEELQAKEQQRQQEVAEIREQNCQKSRRILDDLSAKERIRVRDDNGQERIMPEDERQRRISEAQRGIVDNCASA